MSSRTVFVLGGARSGKSAYAEARATRTGRGVRYVATAAEPGAEGTPDDPEFSDRIAVHRARRPAHWLTVEPGLDLADTVREAGDDCLIIDCLTLWLTRLFHPPGGPGPVPGWTGYLDAFEAALSHARAPVLIVSNEIGLGVVPLGAETRRFVDELGRLNQRIAACADEVIMMVAGIPVQVKP